MKSWITTVFLLGLVALTAIMLLISYAVVSNILNQSVARELNLIAENYAQGLNQRFVRVEDAVDSVAKVITTEISDSSQLRAQGFRNAFIAEIEDIFVSMGEANPGVLALYLRISPELVGGKNEGFFYTVDHGETLKRLELTDLRSFRIPETEEEIDMEHTGWYYLPMFRGEAMWMKPYDNQNIGVRMISYVVPIYVNGDFIGVVGIDFDFSQLVSEAQAFQVLKSGYAYLKEADGSLHYHPENYAGGELHGDEVDELTDNAELMGQEKTGEEIIRYRFDGDDRVMAFTMLRNGMKLVVSDSYDEVFAQRRMLVYQITIIAVALMAAIAAVGYTTVEHITAPLDKLTKVAHQIEEGNYEPSFPQTSYEEINALTNALKYMAAGIDRKDTIMRNLAYADALTGAKNTAAYQQEKDRLNEQIRDGTARFAVVMCDLNYLKRINDTLGHRAGDKALRSAYAILGRTFPHSPVYRVGGDEFAVVLTGDDYGTRGQLLQALKYTLASERARSDNILERISIAWGCAVYEPGRDQRYRAVFERADAAMYEDKRRCHRLDGAGSRDEENHEAEIETARSGGRMTVEALYRLAGGDYVAAVDRIGSREAVLTQLERYEDEACFDDLRRAMHAKDRARASDAAQNLIDTSRRAGFTRIENAGLRLISCLREGNWDEAARRFGTLERLYGRVTDGIRALN